MKTYANTCKRACCWSPQGVCHYGRNCACHVVERTARATASQQAQDENGARLRQLMTEEWS